MLIHPGPIGIFVFLGQVNYSVLWKGGHFVILYCTSASKNKIMFVCYTVSSLSLR